MKKISVVVVSVFILFVAMMLQYQPAKSHSAGAPAGKTNSPADASNCTSCHSGSASLSAGLITSTVSGTGYVPGTVYTITGTASDPSLVRFGFEISPQNNAGALQGSLTITNATETQIVSSKYVTHKTAGTSAPSHTKSWSFDWTAPAAGTGAVTFYGSFLFTNNSNSSSGDVTKTSTLTLQEFIAPSVSIALTSGTNPTCAGNSVTFTATGTNGGATPTYQWQVNGNNAGAGTTFTSTSLTNGQTVTCIMTPTSGSAVTSNSITMTINPLVTPTVSISATSATTLCAGQSFSFSASSANGGSSPAYQWKVNGNNAGTGGTTFTSVLNNNEAVTCVVTSNANCASPTTATSNSISVTVTPLVTPTVTITATSATTLCVGQSFSFSASSSNGGSSPIYQWKVNGNNAGTGGTTFSSVLNNNDAVTCVITSNANCANPTTATSNSVSVTVTPMVTPTVTVTPTTATTLCAGQSFSFSASSTNGGTSPAYQWKVNGNNAGTGGTTFSSVLNNNDAVTCVLTSNANCTSVTTATSNSVSVTVTPLVSPTVSITTPSTTICAGEIVSFTSSNTNGGSSPVYHWKINGNDAGTGSSFSSALNNNDSVSCVLISNASCLITDTAYSNSIPISVIASGGITEVAVTATATHVCVGETIDFTATPANGGSAPTYQWKLNGASAGIDSTLFSITPNNGDSVSCVMVSNATCLSNHNAQSNTVSIVVNPLPNPVITQNGNVLTSSFASTYQWYLNGTQIGGATAQSFTAGQSGDYKVEVTDSNSCSNFSSELSVIVSGIENVSDNFSVKLYPIPNSGSFTIEIPSITTASIIIEDIYGRNVFEKKGAGVKETLNLENISAGFYIVIVKADNKMSVTRMEVR